MRYVIPSLVRAIDVLDLLGQHKKGLSLADLDRMTDIPKSTLFRILVTLNAHHCVQLDEETNTSKLGSKLWELGSHFVGQSDIYHLAGVHMRALASATEETVFLGIMEGGSVVYMRRMESSKSVTIVKTLGQRVPAHSTATGVAMMAFLPPAEVDRMIETNGLVAVNEATMTDPDALRRRLSDVRERGVAVVDGEYNRELLCISAPVFDHTNRPVASLTIALLAGSAEQLRIDELAGMVRDAARTLSSELGHRESIASS
ncbi:MAG: IclR family transcriptional regulator [Bacteroidota bacterium]